MKKFKFLVKNSLLRKLKSKGFIISTIITSVLILAIIIVPTVFQITAKEPVLSNYEVLLIDETTDNKPISEYLIATTEDFYELNITKKSSDYQSDIDNFYVDGKYDVIIQFVKGSSTNLIDVKDVKYYSKLKDSDNSLLLNTVSSTKFALLDDNYTLNIDNIKDPSLEEKPEEPSFNAAIMGISTMIFTVIFMFIVFSTQTLGAEILEEKSTKAIETIISSVPAETHFYAKILSSIVFTAIQLGLMLLTGLIGLFISNLLLSSNNTSLGDIMNLGSLNINLPVVLIFTILSLVLGLVFYLVYFAFFASFANNNEEYQKAQSPLMIILLIIFYGAIILASTNQLNLIRVLAYIPFFTPFLLPISLLTGKVLLLEAIIITVVLGLFIFLSTKLIVPIYRISILDYSGDKLLSSVKRSFKSRKNN